MLIICHISSTAPDNEYPEDPGTVPTAQRSASTIAGKIIDRYGVPTEIYTSPYEAGRKTYEFMKTVVDRRGVCNYSIDTRLGPRVPPLTRLRAETLRFKPLVGEDEARFTERVTNMIAYYRVQSEGKIVWVITHSDVMLLAHKIIKEPPPPRIDYHCYLTIEDSRSRPGSSTPVQLESRIPASLPSERPVETPVVEKAKRRHAERGHADREHSHPAKKSSKPRSNRKTRFEESSRSSDEDFYDTLDVDPNELRKKRVEEKDKYAIEPPRPNLPRFATPAMIEAATRPFIDDSDNEDWSTLPD